ncbi:MAG TPA: GMC family oxidoreductase N-terminal domain-containing protein [Bacillota bacterium]|nr:GMC family oxidoreductase N-terminal domain-containing protein [Bacillota bacterium]
MKRAIIVGSGAGGAMMAKELQGSYDVTVLEQGSEFQAFPYPPGLLSRIRSTGVFFDERLIHLAFPKMVVTKSSSGLLIVTGKGTGGTTPLSAGNAVRADNNLKSLGINLEPEFKELAEEIPISASHRQNWRPATRELFSICERMGLHPEALPKFGDPGKCVNCGLCVLGCKYNAKWDARGLLNKALNAGAKLITNCRVDRVLIEEGKATGVLARKGLGNVFYPADLVVLSAGGLGTPLILQQSGIPCEPKLFVDPVLCVAAEWDRALQNREFSMPFAAFKENYFIAPYFDHLSFFFNKKWRKPGTNIITIMIKLADSAAGSISGQKHTHKVTKELSENEQEKLFEGVALCTEILENLGVPRKDIFLGTLNSGHPGGMLPLRAEEKESFHHPSLPLNLYIADTTLLPGPFGMPPILTTMALAKRVAKICRAG